MANSGTSTVSSKATIWQDQRGAVAILFAIAAVVLISFAGMAVDYGNVIRMKTFLDGEADASSLSAVTIHSSGFSTASGMSSDGPIQDSADAITAAFKSLVATKPGVTLTSVNASVAKQGWSVVSTLSYSASISTPLLSIIGYPTLQISGSSSAASVLPTYIDFYMMLDNSPSMGVAASNADIDKMVAATPDKCAFACHDISAGSNSYYDLAHRLGVTTRIDVLRSATQQLLTTAKGAELVPSQYRFDISTFSMALENITPLTDDLDTAKSQAAAIDLKTVPYQGWNNDQMTDYDTSLINMNTNIKNPGDGISPDNPQKMVFLVSDGVSDAAQGKKRVIAPINTTHCDTMKNRGIKIAVLYTTYLPLPTNGFYNANVAPWVDTIGPTMKSCASPGLYFEVGPNGDIGNALQKLFLNAIQQVRLTH